MSQEGFCDKHGPYPAHKGGCPYCEPASRQAAGRPQRAPSLDDDVTDPFAGRQSPNQAYDNSAETEHPNMRKGSRRGEQGSFEDLDETDFPRRRGGGGRGGRGGFEDLDETDFPRRGRRGDGWKDDDFDADSTVVDRPTRKGLLGWLIVKEGNRRGQFFEVRHDYTIGRKVADIVVRDSKISRQHVKLKIKENQFVIWDLASENGTFVNDEEIMGATPLKENDEIRIGDTVFVLKTLG